MASLYIPPIKTPVSHPRAYPFKLPVQLDPSCVLCLLPIRDDKWYDFSGKGNHGTIEGAIWTAKGRLGPALYIDGLDDYVKTPSINHGSSFTIAGWVKVTSNKDYPTMMATGTSGSASGWRLYTPRKSNQIMRFECADGSAEEGFAASSIVSYDVRHLLGATIVKGGTSTFYLDGVPDGTFTTTKDFITQKPVYIGAVADLYSGCFLKTLFDEAYLFTRAFSASDMLALFELGREVR